MTTVQTIGVVIALAGLDRDGVISCLRQTPGTAVWVPRADSLLELTGGNPLYLRLLVDHLPWTGQPTVSQVQRSAGPSCSFRSPPA